jgi:hypothetical protein
MNLSNKNIRMIAELAQNNDGSTAIDKLKYHLEIVEEGNPSNSTAYVEA